MVDLKINGMSGSDDRPLVIINNETFGVGDTRDVPIGNPSDKNKITIKCLEIDRAAGRATVQVGRDRRDLYFKNLGK